MNKKSDVFGIIEAVLGLLIYLVPIICGFYILTWAGSAYHEGYKLFVEESLDRPGSAHTEMVTISQEEAGSSLAVGRILEKQDLISNGVTFAVKARISGYNGKFLPGTFVLSSDMTMEQMMEKISREPTAEKEKTDGNKENLPGDSNTVNSGGVKENKDVWGQF